MPKRDKHTCPRRAENGMDNTDSPVRGAGRDLDRWPERDGARRCSYCGSMHPDDIMAIARGEQPGEFGPTDKNYKVYVEGTGHGFGKFYFMHLSDEQMSEFVDLYNARPRRQYGETGMTFKVARDGGGKMAVGYPGHFYVLPFFMR